MDLALGQIMNFFITTAKIENNKDYRESAIEKLTWIDSQIASLAYIPCLVAHQCKYDMIHQNKNQSPLS